MKNLMVYLPAQAAPSKKMIRAAKVQMNSALKMGWKAKDILFITNFPFEYGDIKALMMQDATDKIDAVVKMYERNLIKRGQLYWLHDLNTFQAQEFNESEIGYWFTGIGAVSLKTSSLFFRPTSKDMFTKIQNVMKQQNATPDQAFLFLNKTDADFSKKITQLDYSYNFTGNKFEKTYNIATKPIKIVNMSINSYAFFRKNNPLKASLMSPKLVSSFKYHRAA